MEANLDEHSRHLVVVGRVGLGQMLQELSSITPLWVP